MKEIVFSVLLVFVSNNILSQYKGGSGRGDAVVRSTTTTLNGYLPTISSFTPSTVCASSGATVTITGTNFTGATAVSFGGTLATTFTVNSATQIIATVGAGTTGTISVTTPAGTVISTGILTVDPNCTTTKAIFNYTGSNQIFTVPNCGVTSIKVKMWGAGGGSGDNTNGGNGGGGAYVTGTLPVTPGQQLTIIVGQGGARGAVNTTGGYSMSAAFGGGGRGRDEDRGGGGGGGRSAIRLTDGTEVATAAGGGGGGGSGTSTGNGTRYCGGGGGALGGTGGRGGDINGCATTGGCGGSSTTGGGCTNAVNGSQYTGSDGQNNGSQTYGGAGGGGGYWGGEGGNSTSGTVTIGSGGGGGGGSFLSTSFSATSSNGGSTGSASGTSTTIRPSAGNYTDTDNGSTYGGGGNRGASATNNTGSAGQNGRIVIIYDIKTTPVPVITGTYCEGATSINGTSAANASVIVTVNGVAQPAVLANALGNWSTTVSALVAGQSITATAQVTSQCISAASSPVTVNPTNTITLSSAVGTNTPTVCTNSAITNITYTTTGATGATVTGLPTGVTGSWASNVFTISGTPSVSGTFNYTVTMTGGCTGGTNTATGTITVNPAATVNAGSATSICSGVAYSLTGSSIGGSASTGTWSITGVTGTMTNASSQLSSITATTNPSTVIFTPISGRSGTVTLTLTTDDPAGSCPSVSSSVLLTVSSAPAVSVNNATVCPGATATITATPAQSGGTYAWSTGATTSSITTTPSSTTTYTVTYSLSGCSSSAGTGTVTVNPATVSVNSTTVCSGATATITATPSQSGGTYAWSTGATTSSITVSPTSTTTYTVTYTLGSCTPATATGTVTVNPAPTVSVNNATACSGASVTITATPSQTGGTYAWSTGATTSSITVLPISTTSFTVTYTLGNCTPSTATGTVMVNPAITPTFSQPSPICLGETFSVLPTTSNEGITGLWSPDLDTTQTTTYTFIPDAGQCAESTTLTLTVSQVSTGTDIITSCTPITWIDGITYAESNNSATFTIVGGAASGCDSLVTLDLTMLPSPASSTTDETICSSQLPYTWNGLTFNSAGSQTATLEGANGCDSLATLNLTVSPATTPTFTQVGPYLSGASIPALPTTSTNGISGTWSPAINNTATTTYTFTPSAGQCGTTTAMTITINQPLQYTLTANDSTVCAGTTVTLSVNIQPSYPAGTVHCNGTPTAVVDVTNPVTGKTWMDRNLGASRAATSSTDTQAFGDLFQWGRGADGHQCRNSITTTTLSSTDQPGNAIFILGQNNQYYDWKIVPNTNLWQGVNGVNNPCPNGYRLPTEIEWEAEITSFGIQDSYGAFDSFLKLPRAYDNRNGVIGSFGTSADGCQYWSSSLYQDNYSRTFLIEINNLSMHAAGRSHGSPIRCIKN